MRETGPASKQNPVLNHGVDVTASPCAIIRHDTTTLAGSD